MEAGTVVVDPCIDAGSMTDDQILALTQHTRVKIVKNLVNKTPGGLPGDQEERDALFRAMDGLDKVALTRKRIDADKEASSGVSHAVGLVAALLRQSKTNYSLADVVDTNREIPRLSDDIPDPVLVPGETEINAGQLDYDSFVAGRAQPTQE